MKHMIVFLPAILVLLVFFLIFVFVPPPSSRPFTDPLWEIIHTPDHSAMMMRTPVPHGWIVTYKNYARGILFVPDEKHEWKVK